MGKVGKRINKKIKRSALKQRNKGDIPHRFHDTNIENLERAAANKELI